MIRTSDFDYDVRDELIAHEPATQRDQSRLLVLDRAKKTLEHRQFADIVDYLQPGDALILNNTKVIPARLIGEKTGSGRARIEMLLICPESTDQDRQVWKCLVKPGKRLKEDMEVSFAKGRLFGKVIKKLETGEQLVEFNPKDQFWPVVNEIGQVPLPPYIDPKKAAQAGGDPAERYQTVYASKAGASAAPTAGLHFTDDLLKKISDKGIAIAFLTLHTGLATFQPVRTDKIEDHKMHSEVFEIPRETVEVLQGAKRIIAVGTTVVRALESVGEPLLSEAPRGYEGGSDLFIYPGYEFKVVNALITNFHWPRSTLVMLVSAFAGRELVMNAYQEAMKRKYRFFSFGDAMLIL